MKILGIDPGLRITGFGVIEQSGSKLRYITSGCVRSGKGDVAKLAARLLDDAEAGNAQARIDAEDS